MSHLVCFPLKCEWEKIQPVTAEAFPVPLATSRTPAPAARPAPVEELATLARCLGWTVLVTYSHGYVPHATRGVPLGPKEIWAARCSRGTAHAVAVREDGAWASFWDWSDVQFFRRSKLLTDFQGVLL